MDSDSYFPKMPSPRTAYVFLIVTFFLGILSGAAGGILLCDLIAVATGTVALLSMPRPSVGRTVRNALLLAAATLAGSLVAVLAVTGKLRFYCVAALTPALSSLAAALCIYKLRGRTRTVTLVTLIMLTLLALSTLGGYLDAAGSLSVGLFKDVVAEFEGNLRELFNQALALQSADGQTVFELDDATLTTLIRIVEYLFPFFLYLLYFIAAYVATGLVRRILLGFTLGQRSLRGWLLIPSKISCVFYLLASLVCIFTMGALLTDPASGLKASGIVCLVSFAILLLTLIPCLAIGVRRTLFLFRTRRRFGLLGILLAAFACLILPFFIFFYFGFVGAYHAIFDPVLAKMYQNMSPGGPGTPGGFDHSDHSGDSGDSGNSGDSGEGR